MQVTTEQLKRITGKTLPDDVIQAVNQTLIEFKIDTKRKAAMFLAQIAHESGGLTTFKENLNYSAEALLRVFPRYFTKDAAVSYARRPEAIANRVYANRMGNGPELSGDGWRYRGKGAIQITGAINTSNCMKALDLEEAEQICSMPHAIRSAGWFWKINGLNEIAETGDIEKVTKRINGGKIGLDHRTELYIKAMSALMVT